MTNPFDSSSSLVQSIIAILRQFPQGLLPPEIKRALTRQGRPGVQENEIETIARLPEFRRLPGGRIILREYEPDYTSPFEEEQFEYPVSPYESYPSTLKNCPSLKSFVIFDIETNGLDPDRNDFFQLSAIKVIDGQAVEVFN